MNSSLTSSSFQSRSAIPRNSPCASVSENNYVIQELSKQITNVVPVFSKLEWRIEHFENLMRLLKNGQLISSEKFKNEKVPTVAWELHVYPNGKREEDVNNSTFFLRQVGLERETNQGSSVKTDFKIYALGQNGIKLSICRDIKEFVHQQGRGKFRVEHTKMLNVLQEDGSLVVICEVEFLSPDIKLKAELEPVRKVEENAVCNAKVKAKHIVDQISGQLWEDKLYTDCTVQVGTVAFEVHKCILAQHSRVFRSMFAHSSTIEAQSGRIVISDCKPETVRAMLEYMYTGSLDDTALKTCAVELLVASDKYEVIALKEVCEAFLGSSVNNENILKLVSIADLYSASHLKKTCVSHIATNRNTVLRSTRWKALKLEKPHLVNDVLELMTEEHLSQSFVDTNGGTVNMSTPRINDQAPAEKRKRRF
ncbi:BTB/POZ domain-containing protein [Ditylenchus destructor]|uniref:BTB/POZ domain-containing protein n=1 Tax=Ditylenchus destructor TaxID=166010 RepID=A0AAD4QVJ2_9BILA|nr:BTB/POZ domain-containing protein [Ditylenchus destructor]